MKFFAHSTFLNSKELEALLQIKTGLFLSFFLFFFILVDSERVGKKNIDCRRGMMPLGYSHWSLLNIGCEPCIVLAIRQNVEVLTERQFSSLLGKT